jgi:7-carboxy-7-deazaguanine synthase
MPPRRTLRIAEIFASVQGEGLRQGEATIFVRLAGCNLRCPFCDTKSAWGGGRPMSPSEVAAAVRRLRKRWPAAWVDITGGEPLLQDLGPLVRILRGRGFRIQVETNGTIDPPWTFDWISVSPKPPAYVVAARVRPRASEVKLVVSRELTWSIVKRLRGEFPARVPILLQPESNAPGSRAKAAGLHRRSVRGGLANIRLSLQLHKVYGFR